jgi:hypothetical protein
MMAQKSKRNKQKEDFQHLLMKLEILNGWPSDMITLVIDYVLLSAERLLLWGDKYHRSENSTVLNYVTIWSISVESLYHIMMTNDINTRERTKATIVIIAVAT